MDTSTEETLQQFSQDAVLRVKAGEPVERVFQEFESITPVAGYKTEAIAQALDAQQRGDNDAASALLQDFFRNVPGQVVVAPGNIDPEAKGLPQFQAYTGTEGWIPGPTSSRNPKNRQKTLRETANWQYSRKEQEELSRKRSAHAREIGHKYWRALQDKKMSGVFTREAIEKAAEEGLQRVTGQTKEEVAEKLADQISSRAAPEENRQAAKEVAREIIDDEAISLAWDERGSVAGRIYGDPTITDSEYLQRTAVVTESGGVPAPETIQASVRSAQIAALVQNPPPGGAPLNTIYNVKPGANKHRDEVINHVFDQKLINTIEGGVERFTDALGETLVQSEPFQGFLKRSHQSAVDRAGGDAHNMIGRFVSSVVSSPDPDMVAYLGAVYQQQGQSATPKAEQFFDIQAHLRFLELRDLFTLGKGGAAKTAADATAKTKAGELGLKFLSKFAFLPTWFVKIASGPVGWIIFAVTIALPLIKSGVNKALSGLAAGGIGSVKAASGAFAETVQSLLGGARGAKEDPLAANGWLFALLLAASPFLIAIFLMSSIVQNRNAQFLPIGLGGGSGSGPMGPIQYTGPVATGEIGACLNFNVAPKQFGDILARPFTPAQGPIVNTATSQFPQLGNYNCILQCPQNHINLYSGGPSTWWGWAPSASPGNVIIYDGFFASGSIHSQARLLAHELAHEWSYMDPTIEDRFQQEGYCGRLCTYPSGTRGTCSPDETLPETFAESAAMYLVGEDLRALCPRGYDFMDRQFRSCGGAQ